MYLNEFKSSRIKELVDSIKKNKPNVFIRYETDLSKCEHAFLSYHEEVGRLEVKDINLDNPMYCNPDCISELVPYDLFLSKIYGGTMDQYFKEKI